MVEKNAFDKRKEQIRWTAVCRKTATQIPFPYPCQLPVCNAVNQSIIHMQGINNQEDTSIQRGLDGNPTGDGGGGGGF
jgi:hypothetical protein